MWLASLEELCLDYEDYLRQKELTIWEFRGPRRQEVIQNHFKKQQTNLQFVQADSRLILARLLYGMLVLLGITCLLLDRQLLAQAKAFQTEGGFTERLYRMRLEAKKRY
jgi:four helix bundle suffix protein